MKNVGILAVALASMTAFAALASGCEVRVAETPPPPPPRVYARVAPVPRPAPRGYYYYRGRLVRRPLPPGGVAVVEATPGGAPAGAPGGTAPAGSAADPGTAPASSSAIAPPAPVIHGSNALGSDQDLPGSWQAVVYFIPPNSNKLPDFATLKPTATFYTQTINVPARSFTDGFPGVDNHFEWFAVRYENELQVKTEGDYYFRVVSDDGSKFYIDDSLILDNDGVHSPTEKKGGAHLVTGQHDMHLDYFQGPRDQIAAQLYVTPPGGAEKLLTNTLP